MSSGYGKKFPAILTDIRENAGFLYIIIYRKNTNHLA